MAERKEAFAQTFAHPVPVMDAAMPIQRRASGHDPRAQLRQNAQFMAQMKAQRGVVQRKPGLGPTGPPRFRSRGLQSWWASVKPAGLSTSHMAALKLLDRPLTGPWQAGLKWSDAQIQAANRVVGARQISQGDYMVCGPAAVLQAMVESDPVGYAHLVIEVFSRGSVQGKRVNSLLLQSREYPGNPWIQIDWMVLHAMRDVENDFFVTHGAKDELFAGGTSRPDLIAMMKKHLKVRRVESHNNWLLGDSTDHLARVNAALNRGHFVFAMVDADKMKGTRTARLSVPTHWVKLNGPLSASGGLITMHAMSWGNHHTYRFAGRDTLFAFVIGYR